MAKRGSTSSRKPGTMSQQVRRSGGQARMRRELAAQRRAFGAAGVQRAMTNWGLSSGGNRGGSARGGARRGGGRVG